MIKAVRNELSIPVIANGDIRDEAFAEYTLDFTGCDGLMIGRAAMKNPFIFRRVRHYLETGEKLEINRQARQLEDFKTYLTLLEGPIPALLSPSATIINAYHETW